MTRGIDNTARGTDHLVIDVAQLRSGPITIEESIPNSLLEEKLNYCEYDATPERASVKIKVEPIGNCVFVQGTIQTAVRVQCGTCLADTVLHLTPVVSTYLFPKEELESDSEDNEVTPEDLDREWFEGETIALQELLLDAVMLEMPMNPKCGNSCPGLDDQTSFEPENKIDPRLAPLAAVRIEKER
jgi:uncharacterized metal-binding protein YceD (DUF177 family)